MHLINYEMVISAVNRQVRQVLPYPMVEQSDIQLRPDYPFATYTVTSPYLNAKTFKSGGHQVEDVEIVVSYTWLSKNSFEALSLAQRMATMVKATNTRQKLQDAGIAVVRVDGFGNRDNFLTVEYERQVGFDLRLRVRHSDLNEYESIGTVI